jgi:hypothetical protein
MPSDPPCSSLVPGRTGHGLSAHRAPQKRPAECSSRALAQAFSSGAAAPRSAGETRPLSPAPPSTQGTPPPLDPYPPSAGSGRGLSTSLGTGPRGSGAEASSLAVQGVSLIAMPRIYTGLW